MLLVDLKFNFSGVKFHTRLESSARLDKNDYSHFDNVPYGARNNGDKLHHLVVELLLTYIPIVTTSPSNSPGLPLLCA